MKTGIYMKHAKELVEKGEAYYCFCDKERLSTLKTEVVEGKEIMIYDKHCLSLSKEEVEANLAAGKPFVIRQNIPNEGTTTFHDELYGDITVGIVHPVEVNVRDQGPQRYRSFFLTPGH